MNPNDLQNMMQNLFGNPNLIKNIVQTSEQIANNLPSDTKNKILEMTEQITTSVNTTNVSEGNSSTSGVPLAVLAESLLSELNGNENNKDNNDNNDNKDKDKDSADDKEDKEDLASNAGSGVSGSDVSEVVSEFLEQSGSSIYPTGPIHHPCMYLGGCNALGSNYNTNYNYHSINLGGCNQAPTYDPSGTKITTKKWTRTREDLDLNLMQLMRKIDALTVRYVEDMWTSQVKALFQVKLELEIRAIYPNFKEAVDNKDSYKNILNNFNNIKKNLKINNKKIGQDGKLFSKLVKKELEGDFNEKDEQNLQQIIETRERELKELFGEDHEEFKQYISLHEKFSKKLRKLVTVQNQTEELLLNSLRATEQLNRNLAITLDSDYKESVVSVLDSLKIEDLMRKWLLSKSQVQFLKPCLQSQEYEFKCLICDNVTSESNPLHVLDSCGHLSCKECMGSIYDKRCPFCRKLYQRGIRIFLS